MNVMVWDMGYLATMNTDTIILTRKSFFLVFETTIYNEHVNKRTCQSGKHYEFFLYSICEHRQCKLFDFNEIQRLNHRLDMNTHTFHLRILLHFVVSWAIKTISYIIIRNNVHVLEKETSIRIFGY